MMHTNPCKFFQCLDRVQKQPKFTLDTYITVNDDFVTSMNLHEYLARFNGIAYDYRYYI